MAAKKDKKDTKNDKDDKGEVTPENLLGSHLNAHKEDHLNFEEQVNYKVSSGSLIFDIELGGGFGPGAHRLTGITEGGKTSEGLEVVKNFLQMKKARSVAVKTEGRLSEELMERSGVKFVTKAEDWKDGTCFVFECNIYETVFGLFRELIMNNPEKIKYCFLIDSTDGLLLREDAKKPLEESDKVAGGALITSVFLKKTANALAKRGHMMIAIGQVRSEIKLNPYDKTPPRVTNATGGNAILHYSNFILEFEPHMFKDCFILPDQDKKADRIKNRPLGHWCGVTFKKTVNETSGIRITYPIKYGRTGGTSIWKEYEIFDLMLAWKFAAKKKGWIEVNFPQNLQKEMDDLGIACPEKTQGMWNFLKMLEDNAPLTAFLHEKFKEMLADAPS